MFGASRTQGTEYTRIESELTIMHISNAFTMRFSLSISGKRPPTHQDIERTDGLL